MTFTSFKSRPDILCAIAVLAVLVATIFIRPPLPVDETRYLTAAWEMYLKKSWFLLSVNFEPYHHKPPMLFWLINAAWNIFGVSRWAAAIPVLAASGCMIGLTGSLAATLFPEDEDLKIRARIALTGSLPFLIYGSLLMFDIMVGAFAMAALLCLLRYARTKHALALIGYGVFMGCGVLTKGPVVLMYAFLPALLAPLWMPKEYNTRWAWWYPALAAAFIVGFAVTLLWLLPLSRETGEDFFRTLIWKQTADRVAGGNLNIHARPFYFYLMLLPLFMAPWLLIPSFWRNLYAARREFKNGMGLRFLAVFLGAPFLIFSVLILGKQPHYLTPLIPGLFILMAHYTRNVSVKNLTRVTIACAAAFLMAHAYAARTMLPRYDYRPIGNFMQANPDRDWAYVQNYNGELGFLGRMERPLTDTDFPSLAAWFKAHPHGYAIIRYKNPADVAAFEAILPPRPFRAVEYVGVFGLRQTPLTR